MGGNEENRLSKLAFSSDEKKKDKAIHKLEQDINRLEKEVEEKKEKEKTNFRHLGPIKIPDGTITVVATVCAVAVCNAFIPLTTVGTVVTLLGGGVGGVAGRFFETKLPGDVEDDD